MTDRATVERVAVWLVRESDRLQGAMRGARETPRYSIPVQPTDTDAGMYEAADLLRALLDRAEYLEVALRCVAEGRGSFNRDPFEHAKNVIEETIQLATDALAGTWEVPDAHS